jgi:hypothetical protein
MEVWLVEGLQSRRATKIPGLGGQNILGACLVNSSNLLLQGYERPQENIRKVDSHDLQLSTRIRPLLDQTTYLS